MMEREGDEESSYNIAMRDTIILYDTLLFGIELPALVVTAINRKTEQYYISEEYKFRIERERRESERKKIEAEGIRDFQHDRQPGNLRILSALARHRGDAAAVAIDELEDRDHRRRQGRLPIILGNVDTPPAPAAAAPADHEANPEGADDRRQGHRCPWSRRLPRLWRLRSRKHRPPSARPSVLRRKPRKPRIRISRAPVGSLPGRTSTTCCRAGWARRSTSRSRPAGRLRKLSRDRSNRYCLRCRAPTGRNSVARRIAARSRNPASSHSSAA